MQIKPENAEVHVDQRVHAGAEAIAAAITEIATSTSEQDQAKLAKASKIKVVFRYTMPQEFGQMQEAIRGAPHVLLLELPAIALNDVSGLVYLDGDPIELRQALIKKGIIVTDVKDGWQISLR